MWVAGGARGRRESCGVEGHGLDPEGVEGLDHAELVGLVRMLIVRVETLEAENEALRSEIEGLRRDVGRDSTNSGFPPATDDKAAREKRAKARASRYRPRGTPSPASNPAGRGTPSSVFLIRIARSCIARRTVASAAAAWMGCSRSGHSHGRSSTFLPHGLR